MEKVVETDKFSRRIEELADEVIKRVGNPVSELAVAALIESMGYRHVDCPVEFGRRDIFDLARDVYVICKRRVRFSGGTRGRWKISGVRSFLSFFIHYFSGLALGLPIAGQIAFIVLTGYSLWAWVRFTELEATLVAFGTIMSFIVTGGFTQTLGREVTYYVGIGNKATARRIAFQIFNLGTIVVVSIGLMFFVLNLIFSFFDLRVIPVILAYYFLLSELWLSSSIIYAMRGRFSIFVNTVIGTFIVIWLHKYRGETIYTAHLVGLFVSNVLMYLWARFITRLKGEEAKITYISIKAKRPSVLIYVNSPYFKFGFLYFVFLFLDRIISWTAFNQGSYYFFWFRTPYELGMDWALLSFGFTLAILEYVVNDFSRSLVPVQRSYLAVHVRHHNLWFVNFYFKRLAFLFAFGTISIIAVYVGVMQFRALQHIKEVREFFSSPITFRTYYFASVSYLLLAHGLLNNLLFFTLWKPHIGLRSIRVAVLVDLAVGLIASRVISWEFGVLGFFAGAVAFSLVSSYYVIKFLLKIDYQNYSAF